MTLIVSTHMRKYNIHNNYGGTQIMHTHTHMGLCIHIIYNGGYTHKHTGADTCTCTHTHTHTHTHIHTHRGWHMHRWNHACTGCNTSWNVFPLKMHGYMVHEIR